MKKSLFIDILACPIDKHHPLELFEISTNTDSDEVIEGILFCSLCKRYYPIIDKISIMLPDELRDRQKDISFLERWQDKLPDKILNHSNPWHL